MSFKQWWLDFGMHIQRYNGENDYDFMKRVAHQAWSTKEQELLSHV